MSSKEKHDRYVRVFSRANLGNPVTVWYEGDTAMTDLGPVYMPRRTSAGDIENVGPVLLIRRSTKPRASEFQIAGNGILEAAKLALKFDDQKRLYLTITAVNGQWTWQLRRATGPRHYELDDYELYVGIWRD